MISNKNLPESSKVKIINVKFGTSVKIIEPCNLYDCQIDDNCFVGPFVEIQSSCRIGKNTRIQSHSFLCSKVSIGNDCFIGHGVMFVNDLFKFGGPAVNESDILTTQIGDNVSIGSGSSILPVNIVNGTVIGAGSVVTKNLTVKGIYAGNPAKLIRKL